MQCDPVFLFQMRAEEAVINRDKIFTPSTLLAQISFYTDFRRARSLIPTGFDNSILLFPFCNIPCPPSIPNRSDAEEGDLLIFAA